MSVRRSWEVWAYLDEVDDARHPVVPLFVAHVRRAAQVAAVGPDTTCNTICPSGCTGCSRHESRVRRKRNELPVNGLRALVVLRPEDGSSDHQADWAIQRDPFSGIGKPEPPKGELSVAADR